MHSIIDAPSLHAFLMVKKCVTLSMGWIRNVLVMRSQFLLVPAAIIAAAVPAHGMSLTSLEAGRAALFGDTALIESDFTLTREQVAQLKEKFEVPVMHAETRAWRAANGGWLYLDQVFGLNDVITYLVALDKRGAVTGVEVLVCAEGFCDIATAEWKSQFLGKRHGRDKIIGAVSNISGSTLSAVHITEGVKKVLAIHNLYAPKGKP